MTQMVSHSVWSVTVCKPSMIDVYQQPTVRMFIVSKSTSLRLTIDLCYNMGLWCKKPGLPCAAALKILHAASHSWCQLLHAWIVHGARLWDQTKQYVRLQTPSKWSFSGTVDTPPRIMRGMCTQLSKGCMITQNMSPQRYVAASQSAGT